MFSGSREMRAPRVKFVRGIVLSCSCTLPCLNSSLFTSILTTYHLERKIRR